MFYCYGRVGSPRVDTLSLLLSSSEFFICCRVSPSALADAFHRGYSATLVVSCIFLYGGLDPLGLGDGFVFLPGVVFSFTWYWWEF